MISRYNIEEPGILWSVQFSTVEGSLKESSRNAHVHRISKHLYHCIRRLELFAVEISSHIQPSQIFFSNLMH